jgi:ubiquinone/menaquinone biosynthesis C-methylase UbiE
VEFLLSTLEKTRVSAQENSQPTPAAPWSARKRAIAEFADRIAPERARWIARNAYYYRTDREYMRFLIPEGARVLDVGCGRGDLLAALKPSMGLGIDLSQKMIEIAREVHPELEFRAGDVEDPAFVATLPGPFDFIVLSDTIGLLDDIETVLSSLHSLSTRETRIVIAYYAQLWEPVLAITEKLGLKMPQPPVNFISDSDFINILDLSDFEVIREERRQLVPRRLLGAGSFVNRYIAPLPLIRGFCLRTYFVARSKRHCAVPEDLSTTILIPCRNERANIEPAITRLPRFGARQEVLFVEGNSSDSTYEECLRVKEAYKDRWDISVYKQNGRGKGDAVRLGFEKAKGDVVMILDADLTMPPEALPKFYSALASGKGEFINGTRLVYPMEQDAMRTLNFMANRFFARVFSYLINQRFTDTLCGTKVLRRADYRKIEVNRGYFGDFDPFGDFDLILGAARQNLKIVEIPIHYGARTYGSTQISRFSDGFMLMRMVLFAFKKLKAI